MTDSRSPATRRAWLAVLDSCLLVAYIALQAPGGATGFVLHEWIGLGFIPLFVLHLVVSRRWIVATWRRIRTEAAHRARVNFLLNASLFTMMVVLIVSGLCVSEFALPSVGVRTLRTQRWEHLHNLTSSLIAPVVALHLALNWNWIAQTWRRYFGPLARRPEGRTENVS